MADNETTEDVIAAMRNEGHTGESSCLEWVGTKMRYYADRLETALKRERESADAKIADLQSRIKLWTDRSAELVKKCDELYADARKSKCGEAAHRRELSKNTSKNKANFGQLGDCAKLCEALEILRELLGDLLRLEEVEYHNDFLNFCDIIDAALAAPPRNCDRFKTAAEAIDAYQDLTGDQLATDSGVKEWVEFAAWLFAPATEKEGDSK